MNQDETPSVEKSLAQIAHYFSYRPTGFYSTIGRIDEKLGQLNANLLSIERELKIFRKEIKRASESSDKLTESLNGITKVGVIATVVAAIIAAIGLVPSFYEFLRSIGISR